MKKLLIPLAVVLICATFATTAFATSSPTADTVTTTTDTIVEEEVVEETTTTTTTTTTTATTTEEEETVTEDETEDVETETVVDISAPLPVLAVEEIVPTIEYDLATLDEEVAEIIEEFVLTITELVVVVTDGTETDAADGTTGDSAEDGAEETVMFAAEGTTQVGYDGTLYVFEEGLSSNLSAQAQEHVTAGQMVASFDLVLTHTTEDVVLSLPAGTVVSVEVSLSDDRNYAILHDLGVTSTEVVDGVSTTIITYNGTNVELLDAVYQDGQLSFAVNSSSPFAIIALPLELETKSPDTGVSLIDAMATVAP